MTDVGSDGRSKAVQEGAEHSERDSYDALPPPPVGDSKTRADESAFGNGDGGPNTDRMGSTGRTSEIPELDEPTHEDGPPKKMEVDDVSAAADTVVDAIIQATARASSDNIKKSDSNPGIVVKYYGTTDVGLVREHNEDNLLIADLSTGLIQTENGVPQSSSVNDLGLTFAVCDGMGGAAAGEIASQMAVDTVYGFLSQLEPPENRDQFARRLVTAIEESGNRIFRAAKMDRSRRGMGTTATVAGLIDKVLFVGQVGDSRAYVLRDNKLSLITKDQSLVNQLIEAGQLTEEEANAFEHSNIILQALGTTEQVVVDLTFLELRAGDKLMLCSDGLSGLVNHEEIESAMREHDDLPACAHRLIELANQAGGHDNVTVICAQFGGPDLESPTDGAVAAYQQYPLPPATGEERHSFRPRALHMKSGSPKPGADVKRVDLHGMTVDPGGEEGGAQADGLFEGNRSSSPPPSEVSATDGGERTVGQTVSRWPYFVGVVAVAAAAAAAAFLMGRSTANSPSLDGVGTATVDEPAPVRVDVRVRTEIAGELWVNDHPQGVLNRRNPSVVLELTPGDYSIQLREGRDVLAEQDLQVKPGAPSDVVLSHHELHGEEMEVDPEELEEDFKLMQDRVRSRPKTPPAEPSAPQGAARPSTPKGNAARAVAPERKPTPKDNRMVKTPPESTTKSPSPGSQDESKVVGGNTAQGTPADPGRAPSPPKPPADTDGD